MSSITRMFLSASGFRDWVILLVLGSLFETARRVLASLWNSLINSFFLVAVFDEDDTSYQWIMLWLSKHPSWKNARNVEISTGNFGMHSPCHDDSDNSQTLTYLPAESETYTLWHNYRWMRVTRLSVSSRGGWSTKSTLTLNILSRDHHVLEEIVQEAKKQYLEAQKESITVCVSDSTNCWRPLATRPKRPLDSIVLDPGIMELVVEDARDFLRSKSWYCDRGIPFRRGYLLYGAPGSGKTSLIHSIAGELGLNVYIVSLSRSGLDDTALSELISDLPERCIALMEDIDAAFHHGFKPEQTDASKGGPPAPTSNRVSLSGLLNALDGIGAQEGRILFATTNNHNSLDPALCRPGRMDLHIEFHHASKYQAEELFKRFYAPSPADLAAEAKSGKIDAGSVDSGFDDSSTSNDLVDLSGSSDPPTPSASELSAEKTESIIPPAYSGVSHRARAPKLSTKQISELAKQFHAFVPERRLSMASIQGFLMTHKVSPYEAVADAAAWVEKELKEEKEEKKSTATI
ncbi:P-loop containing nucleoside triphosphate hydrolase protein [Melanogaster broomeanus]|nr:P-loop containing nucleoside triphosphate hydrolase protein [Melanogaster broomeanus]